MGSSFSLQSKDKRRRSNRLSKPPQNQAAPGCSDSLSPRQPHQALSLPSTPTVWQNPWTGISVPISPKDAVSSNPRSQSVSSTPVRRATAWQSNGRPMARRNAHSSADIWPQSPASPGPAPSRRGSVYGRTSFHPSEIATFQPTTLQSNPQSPLMGQPKRSYSVHSPPQRPRNGVQRRTLDRFASINSHSRVNSQDSLPIRRRSLLVRPGVATRKATKSIPPTFVPEKYQNSVVAPTHNTHFTPTQPAFLTHEGIIYKDFETFSQLRPPTPSDLGYTHLGALKLGSLRVVNGSASPCSSDRTRLGHTGSPTPEAISETMDSTDLLRPVERDNCVSRPTSPGKLEIYAQKCHPVLHNAMALDRVMGDFPGEAKQEGVAMANYQVTSGRNDMPATTLNIPSTPAVRNGVDFPISPFSFDESPTSDIPHRRAVFRGVEDEGISIPKKERSASVSEKLLERHLSYSSYASSHKKMDSGYSSATSHRTSIDSHASLRRSPGFKRFALGDSARDIESPDRNTSSKTDNQHPVDHHLMLQEKFSGRPDFYERPMSVSGVQRNQPHFQVNGRVRGLSLPLPKALDNAISFPLYSAQLHNFESTSSSILSPTTLGNCGPGTGQLDESLCWTRGLGGASDPYSTHLTTQMGHAFEDDANQGANFSRHSAAHHDMHNQHRCPVHRYQTRFEHGSSRESFTAIATRQHRRHGGDVKPDIWFPEARNKFPSFPVAEQLNNENATEPPRGRTRSRSTGHQYPRPSGQQPSYFAGIYA